jgi:uncharacterized protein YbjT (DUF2867 family)
MASNPSPGPTGSAENQPSELGTQVGSANDGGHSASKTVLVTAAGGHQGNLLIPKLVASGFTVRAVRGTPGKEDELLELGAHQAVAADLSDVDRYTEALDGVDVVYHIGPSASPGEHAMGEALIAAARRACVSHVVFSSVLHPIIDIVQHRIKRDLEERLIESGLNFTVLKPCDFMMPEQYSLPAFEMGIFPAFWPLDLPRKGSLIDLNDLTDVAAKVIREGRGHYFASYELVGPDMLTAGEVAEILSRVTRRKVSAVEWKPEDMLEHMFGADRTSPEARHHLAVISSVSRWYGQHNFVGSPNVLAWLLGRKPTSFEEFATAAFAQHNQEKVSRFFSTTEEKVKTDD